MPPHNKKNKGKRREKNVRESLKYQKRWLPLLEFGDNKKQGHCNHGVMEVEIPAIDHPVTHFINSLFKNEDTEVLSQGVLSSAVWNNASFEALAKKLLTALGTQCLLKSSLKNNNSMEMSVQAENIALAIYALELYERRSKDLTIEQRDDILVDAMIDNQKTGSNVMDGNVRDLLKFYHKRLDCNCLKQKYSLARKVLPKIGKCSNCQKTFERRLLLTCSVCKSNGSLYCSPKCQRAHYHHHMDDCLGTMEIRRMQPGFYSRRNDTNKK